MNATVLLIIKRVDNAWLDYQEELNERYSIDNSSLKLKERWAVLMPLLENAFKAGAASGGLISAEISRSNRNN